MGEYIKGYVAMTAWNRSVNKAAYNKLHNHITQYTQLELEYNKLADIKNIAATIPREYLSHVHLDRKVDSDSLRILIVNGAEKRLSEIVDQMLNIEKVIHNIEEALLKEGLL